MALASFSALGRATALDHADADQSGPEQVEGKRFRNRRGGAVRVAAGQRQMRQVRLPTAAIREVDIERTRPVVRADRQIHVAEQEACTFITAEQADFQIERHRQVGQQHEVATNDGRFQRRRYWNLRPADRLDHHCVSTHSLYSASVQALDW
jgi:hypothetical protein